MSTPINSSSRYAPIAIVGTSPISDYSCLQKLIKSNTTIVPPNENKAKLLLGPILTPRNIEKAESPLQGLSLERIDSEYKYRQRYYASVPIFILTASMGIHHQKTFDEELKTLRKLKDEIKAARPDAKIFLYTPHIITAENQATVRQALNLNEEDVFHDTEGYGHDPGHELADLEKTLSKQPIIARQITQLNAAKSDSLREQKDLRTRSEDTHPSASLFTFFSQPSSHPKKLQLKVSQIMLETNQKVSDCKPDEKEDTKEKKIKTLEQLKGNYETTPGDENLKAYVLELVRPRRLYGFGGNPKGKTASFQAFVDKICQTGELSTNDKNDLLEKVGSILKKNQKDSTPANPKNPKDYTKGIAFIEVKQAQLSQSRRMGL
jgi:chaperonin cofactor prefoldin